MSLVCSQCSLCSSVSFCITGGRDVPHSRLASESHLYDVYRAKLCEQRDDKEDDVEDEEKDPVCLTQVEPAQRDNDEGQDQRQTQRSCKNPRQQTLRFKLRRQRRRCIMFTGSKTVSCICDLYILSVPLTTI